MLIVDDNRVNLKLAVRLVNKLGYEAVTAMNGQEAVDMFLQSNRDSPIRAILMDKEMPILNGLEAVQVIRRLEQEVRRIPIVALTAAAMTEDREACLAAGCDSYLTKPIDRNALKQVLFEYIQGATAC